MPAPERRSLGVQMRELQGTLSKNIAENVPQAAIRWAEVPEHLYLVRHVVNDAILGAVIAARRLTAMRNRSVPQRPGSRRHASQRLRAEIDGSAALNRKYATEDEREQSVAQAIRLSR